MKVHSTHYEHKYRLEVRYLFYFFYICFIIEYNCPFHIIILLRIYEKYGKIWLFERLPHMTNGDSHWLPTDLVCQVK